MQKNQGFSSLILLALASVVSLAVFGTFYLSSYTKNSKNKAAQQGLKPSQKRPSKNALPNNLPLSSPQAAAQERADFQHATFRLQYPKAWRVVQKTKTPVGTQVRFTFTNAQYGASAQQLSIDVLPNSETSIESLSAALSALGYARRNTQISGRNALLFVGAINAPSASVQERAVVFENNGNVYKLLYAYNAKESIRELEDQFSSLLASFQLL